MSKTRIIRKVLEHVAEFGESAAEKKFGKEAVESAIESPASARMSSETSGAVRGEPGRVRERKTTELMDRIGGSRPIPRPGRRGFEAGESVKPGSETADFDPTELKGVAEGTARAERRETKAFLKTAAGRRAHEEAMEKGFDNLPPVKQRLLESEGFGRDVFRSPNVPATTRSGSPSAPPREPDFLDADFETLPPRSKPDPSSGPTVYGEGKSVPRLEDGREVAGGTRKSRIEVEASATRGAAIKAQQVGWKNLPKRQQDLLTARGLKESDFPAPGKASESAESLIEESSEATGTVSSKADLQTRATNNAAIKAQQVGWTNTPKVQQDLLSKRGLGESDFPAPGKASEAAENLIEDGGAAKADPRTHASLDDIMARMKDGRPPSKQSPSWKKYMLPGAAAAGAAGVAGWVLGDDDEPEPAPEKVSEKSEEEPETKETPAVKRAGRLVGKAPTTDEQIDKLFDNMLQLEDKADLPKGLLEEQLAKLQDMRERARAERKDTESIAAWGEIFGKVAGALTKYAAARYGLKHGIDLSGVKVEPVDLQSLRDSADKDFSVAEQLIGDQEKYHAAYNKEIEDRAKARRDILKTKYLEHIRTLRSREKEDRADRRLERKLAASASSSAGKAASKESGALSKLGNSRAEELDELSGKVIGDADAWREKGSNVIVAEKGGSALLNLMKREKIDIEDHEVVSSWLDTARQRVRAASKNPDNPQSKEILEYYGAF